jgi:hypothetical protein
MRHRLSGGSTRLLPAGDKMQNVVFSSGEGMEVSGICARFVINIYKKERRVVDERISIYVDNGGIFEDN